MKRYKAPVFAVCVNNSEYPVSLELHKLYRVLPDEDSAQNGDLRIVDESGEDYLYPADYFVILEMPRRAERTLNVLFTRLPAFLYSIVSRVALSKSE